MVIFKRYFPRSNFAQMTQRLFLILADNGKLADLHLWLDYHLLYYSHDALCQSIAKSCRINRVIVLNQHTTRLNLDINLELRYIEFQQFSSDRLASNGIFRQHTYLIGIGNGRNETIISGDTGKRIVLVTQRLVEGVAHLTQIFANSHIVNLQAKGKGVDKHSHRIGNLQVRASAANRREINFSVVGIARDNITGSSKIKVCRSNLLLTAESRSLI